MSKLIILSNRVTIPNAKSPQLLAVAIQDAR
jgi:hypothetical protein